ncbi:MAG: SsrA-binding protein SmpB [Myxococcales bacterium]|nr:SsrA-binding protein SmpB [Myxococcales bacterium]
MAERPKKDEKTVLVRNRRARHEYHVEETIEAGIELRGSEVKSLRASQASVGDSYATVKNGEIFLVQFQINEYPQATHWNHTPMRERRLLLHKREIDKLATSVNERGYTLVPLELYLKNGRVKVALGLCKGKQQHDKRQAARERTDTREVARELADRRRR